MEGLAREYSESFDSDFSSDYKPKPPHDYLCFLSTISNDLRAHFSRNSGKEDYCEDIYEDIYSTPFSGSYSYYKDLIDVAQNAETRKDHQRRARFEFHEQPASTFSEFFCSSACSGHFNPNVGTGPFEELFQVLDPVKHSCCLQAPGTCSYTNTTNHFPQKSETMEAISSEILGNSSLDDSYSEFIDIFNRWTSDGFPTEFPSYSQSNF